MIMNKYVCVSANVIFRQTGHRSPEFIMKSILICYLFYFFFCPFMFPCEQSERTLSKKSN